MQAQINPDSLGASLVGSAPDINLFDDSSDLSSETNGFALTSLIGGDADCPVLDGKSRLRKRDGLACPSQDLPMAPLSLPELPLQSDGKEKVSSVREISSPTIPRKAENYDMDKCRGLPLIDFYRLIHVCCDGPTGSFVIDSQLRVLYKWIETCRMGTSRMD